MHYVKKNGRRPRPYHFGDDVQCSVESRGAGRSRRRRAGDGAATSRQAGGSRRRHRGRRGDVEAEPAARRGGVGERPLFGFGN